jgi:chromosome segregation protein
VRYLKQLTLQGYKTFASRTEFIFDAGVTAIVGPNGSGKSNVADALRWVLGEQSFSALRGKRTEDMIFSGSEQRPRMGMAQVSLILDNASGWLPVDFAEVEVSRRAYRSGENEYYVNGNRVRLRDVVELLGSSGLSQRTYTVIGQGLVDQALSLRPEERRKLFEEAAGITVHQAKREQASQKLADASSNLMRARDIISELTPRLRYLKGQARRAQEYQQLKADLEAQLKTWYGYRWRQALLALAGARNRAADAAVVAEEETAELNRLLEQVAARREERSQLRDQLSDWHRASSALHRQAETVQRELAVRNEQVRLWREQADDLGRELNYLAAALEDGKERLQAARTELAQAQGEHASRAKRVEAAQADLQRRERERAAQARVLAQAEDALLTLRTQLAERRSRLAHLADRRVELAGADAEQANAAKAAAGQIAELEAQLKTLGAKGDEFSRALAAIEHDRQVAGQALATSQEAERKAQEQLNASQRAVGRLQDQQEMLERLRDEGAGLGGGVRAVMVAARGVNKPGSSKKPGLSGGEKPGSAGSEKPGSLSGQHLDGILGPLGELIQVPPEYERAMEAALGGRVQDVVVRGWEDAEAAVEFLKRNQAGRATFLPLDTLRPGRPADVPKGPGIIGLASELVGFDPVIRAAVDLALNHTLVVENLPTARRLLNRGGGATLVTLEGEIVRPSGSVTGGAENRQRDGGMLQRTRQLRELPEQIKAAMVVVAGHEKQIAALRKAQADARTSLDSLRARRDELNASLSRLNSELSKTQLAAERARQTVSWHEERRKGLEREAGELDRREGEFRAAIADLLVQIEKREGVVETERRRLNELSAEEYVAELARLRAEAAVSAGQLRSLEGRAQELQRAQASREQEIAAKATRRTSLAEQQAEASEAIDAQSAIAERLAAEIGELTACIDPAEARLAELEKGSRESEQQERALREQLRLAQARQNQADMSAQRGQDELAHLRGEIEKDLGLVELTQFADDPGESQEALAEDLLDTQPPLPLNGMVTRLPVVSELPEGLDADVRNLRGQMARLGPVNLDALAEYQEVESRYNFLTTQSADLEHAVASLQEVIAELDRVMEREFVTTFKAVAARFKDEFVNLFGGGSAKLMMADPENPNSTGIEIIARPPGKREQGLALLSGGERALTAAALIFSILKTRPTPFCVLDEVDAALDEANVGRFRDAIKNLGKDTQFILVTHNRGTIEAADTIYGISMGADHTSTTLSLKLDGKELVTAAAVEA